MPPNVKEAAAVVDHLATLSIKDLVAPKHVSFAPLTASPTNILKASHIEANLVSESTRLQQDEAGKSRSDLVDDYWAEAQYADEDTEVAKEELLQKRLTEKKQTLDRILYEEEIRQLLKIEHIEEKLVSQAPATYDTSLSNEKSDDFWSWRNQNEASWRHDPYHVNQNYWEWPTLSREDEKQRLIQQILKDEEVREKFSIASIEKQLNSRTASVEQTETSDAVTAHSDDYWGW